MTLPDGAVRLVFLCALATTPHWALAVPSVTNPPSDVYTTVPGGTVPRSTTDRAVDVINIADYGAKCDGTTNDNAAINAAVLAAYNSAAYQNNDIVEVTGPRGSAKQACVINSINATMFTKGAGGNPRARLILSGMTLLCTGAANICLDGMNSSLLKVRDVAIRGDSAAPPAICIQVGAGGGMSAAWHSFDRVSCNFDFTFTALYNVGSEDNSYLDSFFVNNWSATGPLRALGTVTGGAGYTNGTYTGVALTGGTGAGALATITVSGGSVTAAVLTYQGRDYTAGDTLSAVATSLGGTGSGFSVPAASTKTFAAIIDGANHWRASSAFASVTLPVDTYTSTTLINFLGSNMRGAQGGLWLTGTGGLRMVNTYILAGSESCVDLADYGAGVSKWGHNLELNCEGSSQSAFLFTGTNANPRYTDFRFRGYHQATAATFRLDTGIASVTLNGADLDLHYNASTVPMWSQASAVSVSGRVSVQTPEQWNAPAAFEGQLLVGTRATPPGLGPIDILSNAALALSCSRQLNRAYVGALCQVQRTSDSATFDVYPDGFGNADRGGLRAFCNGTACGVSIAYDQSGNGATCTQATAASQPVIRPQNATLGGRTTMTWTTASALSCGISTPLNDIFATNGFMVAAVLQSSNAQPNRLWAKINSSGSANPGVGMDFRVNPSAANPITLDVGATTNNGVWTTSASLALGVGHVYDMQYSASSTSNAPVIGVDGATMTLGATAPVGTISSDAAYAMLIGNNTAAAGATRGFIGDIGDLVFWKSATPSSAQIEAIRRNEAGYYSIGGVQ